MAPTHSADTTPPHVPGAKAASSPGANGSPPVSADGLPRLSRCWRVAMAIIVGLALALGFAGYLSPGMRIQWANFMSLCGF